MLHQLKNVAVQLVPQQLATLLVKTSYCNRHKLHGYLDDSYLQGDSTCTYRISSQFLHMFPFLLGHCRKLLLYSFLCTLYSLSYYWKLNSLATVSARQTHRLLLVDSTVLRIWDMRITLHDLIENLRFIFFPKILHAFDNVKPEI